MGLSEEDKKKYIKPRKKNWYNSEEDNKMESQQELIEGLMGKGFEVIRLEPPKGGLCYMKRIKYLNDPKYEDLPQFITARGMENGIGIFQSQMEGGAFLKELPEKEFDKVFEID
jgi:hypothetical protein